MPERTPQPALPSKEDIKAQEALLDTIHTAQALEMSIPVGDEQESIIKKTRARLGLVDGEAAELRVKVGKIYVPDSDHPNDERIWMEAKNKQGRVTTRKQVAVGSVLEGVLFPGEQIIVSENGYVDEEVLALKAMVDGLRTAKESGALSQLNATASDIHDPYTAIMKLPPIQK